MIDDKITILQTQGPLPDRVDKIIDAIASDVLKVIDGKPGYLATIAIGVALARACRMELPERPPIMLAFKAAKAGAEFEEVDHMHRHVHELTETTCDDEFNCDPDTVLAKAKA